ncbi:MAG: M1 family aminopeptidase [Candidatus Heimdallarchaeota archaeon]
MKLIKHHDLEVKIDPHLGTLSCIDTIKFDNLNKEIELYLGKRFVFNTIHQNENEIQFKELEEGKITKKYLLENLDTQHNELTFEWKGKMDNFEGYRVNTIRSDVIELSGFCGWFPTIAPSSQLEKFTYSLKIQLPKQWKTIVPGVEKPAKGNVSQRFEFTDRLIQDIVICSSPQYKEYSKGKVTYVMPEWSKEDIEILLDDYAKVVTKCEELFGKMIPGTGGTAVISIRKEGEEWGYERGNIWVVGDSFANYWLKNNKIIKGLTKSLAAHESIHAWFGIGVEFENDWLAEAITQYLEVIVTSIIYDQPDLPERYFKWYQERAMDALKMEDKAIADFIITENTYVYWYLKGSWTLWDFEHKFSRNKVFDFLSSIFNKYKNKSISYTAFKKEANLFFNEDLDSFFDHWFLQKGFNPKFLSP